MVRGLSGTLPEPPDRLQMIIAFLDHDERPTLVVARSPGVAGDAICPSITYYNEALRNYFCLESLEDITQGTKGRGPKSLAAHAFSRTSREGGAEDLLYDGNTWTRHFLGQNWGIICLKSTPSRRFEDNAINNNGITRPHKRRRLPSNNQVTAAISERHLQDLHTPDYLPSPESTTESTDAPASSCLDWTRYPQDGLSDYVQSFRKHDWSRTSLGPMDDWSLELRSNIFLIMNNPDPRVLLWGPDLALVYNEACAFMMGKKHPSALGLSGAVGFAEGWPPLLSNIKEVMHTGRSKQVQDHYVPVGRNGLMQEETYFSYTLLPILDENGVPVVSHQITR